jgi:hypothetical protein
VRYSIKAASRLTPTAQHHRCSAPRAAYARTSVRIVRTRGRGPVGGCLCYRLGASRPPTARGQCLARDAIRVLIEPGDVAADRIPILEACVRRQFGTSVRFTDELGGGQGGGPDGKVVALVVGVVGEDVSVVVAAPPLGTQRATRSETCRDRCRHARRTGACYDSSRRSRTDIDRCDQRLPAPGASSNSSPKRGRRRSRALRRGARAQAEGENATSSNTAAVGLSGSLHGSPSSRAIVSGSHCSPRRRGWPSRPPRGSLPLSGEHHRGPVTRRCHALVPSGLLRRGRSTALATLAVAETGDETERWRHDASRFADGRTAPSRPVDST